MTKEEKKLAYQTIVLLDALRKETKKQLLKDEIDRLIIELQKRID